MAARPRRRVATLLSAYDDRPALAWYIAVTHGVLREHATLHVLWAIALAALAATLVYALARRAGIAFVHAVAVALYDPVLVTVLLYLALRLWWRRAVVW